MKVLVASDSFKGSMSSLKVGEAVKEGIAKVFADVQVRIVPIADGGEGTVETLVKACGGEIISRKVTSPLGNPIEAEFAMLPDNTAVIEMASASGLPLVPPDKKNPSLTTTYGTGELIKHALDYGAGKVLIGIGGSATNDGGMGMAQALGVRFLDSQGQELNYGGGSLSQLADIGLDHIDPRLKEVEFTVMCDVDNPLCGSRGASAVYGPQKGATPLMVKQLDSNLAHYAEMIKNKLGIDIKDVPGSGAAGGLGAGLMAFTNAVLRTGVEAILDTIDFDKMLEDIDLVITGEGKIDSQSVYGKVPKGVASRAYKNKKPALAIVGSIGEGAQAIYEHGIEAIIPIVDKPMSLEEAVATSYDLTVQAAERAFRTIAIGRKLS